MTVKKKRRAGRLLLYRHPDIYTHIEEFWTFFLSLTVLSKHTDVCSLYQYHQTVGRFSICLGSQRELYQTRIYDGDSEVPGLNYISMQRKEADIEDHDQTNV